MRRAYLLFGAIIVTAVAVAVLRARRTGDTPSRRAGAPSDGPPDDTAPPGRPRPHTDERPLPEVLIDPEVIISKSARSLSVLSAGVPVKRYGIALGTEPVGGKEREGDGRTPEGVYYICTKNPESRYHRALGLSYPNLHDAERGIREGLISRRDERLIGEAIRHMKQPPWHTALGGEIMIHGGGVESDWTAGCISVEDRDAEELFDALPLGTTVTIAP